ncbi:hypothetical protein [Methylobacterium soli]|uniref:Uncharacterized protein n=1 Tax=Methylobacterium soli TaxID=553447 RepID=A0A6L3SRN2_9HYPH|nr:hypothetical protein [Methylobacterium soli]KAB1075434.1 hypothetical protein F6X53_25050 [Methylobacterium soli]GJE41333.1 hypothetical protein AEGHOMDF_0497 [Methylobacterium soli]
MPYDLRRPTSPVPLERQQAVVAEAAKRWWDFYTRTKADDQMKWFDCDIALAEGGATLGLLAELSKLTSDEYVRDLLARAIEKHSAGVAA